MPAPQDLDLVAVLGALADPARLEIVAALAQVPEAACGQLLEGRMAKSTRSHHLRVLREAGVIAVRAEGTYKFSRLRRDDLDTRFPGLLDAIVTGALPVVGGNPPAAGPLGRAAAAPRTQ
ncbi:helix-turn-helix transcriptional regulator [Frankia sp. CNm7]|uniref:Helix-turn-helix transcriptional regulator n=2 Tax=Frankia nepalensis TaxID=1836974 RepID=A0A937R585_9ACTN|nr:helix-turn-helix transcriptional regulator [Frankia nepalensis]MBL7510743.1 helix-turn-helix transcriptional regulator [Frankia nepalensis]MBL7522666.1 helix-turn-helix transcriptional regulator [Frankia nepalensis]MBL7625983.1 helix-turn-helix transcriptional regulator [Frankia nepalensis]